MNYLVISPYYPQNFQQFSIELANKGITVLGIGQEPYEQLDESRFYSLTPDQPLEEVHGSRIQHKNHRTCSQDT